MKRTTASGTSKADCKYVPCDNAPKNGQMWSSYRYAPKLASDQCKVMDCFSKPPPSGKFFYSMSNFKWCLIKKCTNAKVGQYYTAGAAIGSTECPVAACTNTLKPGEKYISSGTCTVGKCAPVQAGYYAGPNCVPKPCANAKTGQIYNKAVKTPVGSTSCPVLACPNKLQHGQSYGPKCTVVGTASTSHKSWPRLIMPLSNIMHAQHLGSGHSKSTKGVLVLGRLSPHLRRPRQPALIITKKARTVSNALAFRISFATQLASNRIDCAED